MKGILTILAVLCFAGTAYAQIQMADKWADVSETDAFSDETEYKIGTGIVNGMDSGVIAVGCFSPDDSLAVAVVVKSITLLSMSKPEFKLRVDKGTVYTPFLVNSDSGFWMGEDARALVLEFKIGNSVALRAKNTSDGDTVDFNFNLNGFSKLFHEIILPNCDE